MIPKELQFAVRLWLIIFVPLIALLFRDPLALLSLAIAVLLVIAVAPKKWTF